MCNPEYLLLASGTLGAGSDIAQGEGAADVANANARAADIAAQDVLARGSTDEARYRDQIKQVIGDQNAAFGANNVTRSGTALDLLADTAKIGEEDALTIRGNAGREARGLREDGRLMREEGRLAKRMSRFRGGTTLLTSGAQAYGYNRMRG